MGRASYNKLFAKSMECDVLTINSTYTDIVIDGHFSSAIISTGYALFSSITVVSTATITGAMTVGQCVLSSAVISTGTACFSQMTVVSTGTIGTARLSSAVISTGTAVFSQLTVPSTATIDALTVTSSFIYTPSTATTSITFATSTMTLTGAASTKLSWGYQTMYLQRGVVVNFSTITSTYIITA